MSMKIRKITICCSASFYKQALDIERKLQERGFKVKIPHTAYIMEESGDFNVETYKTWYQNASDWDKKTELMKTHFQKVLDSDAILVLNYEKNGIEGYIGGNGLMEMALAFHYEKPIYVLNPVSEALSVYEEVMGMQPTFLDGDIGKIQ